MAQIKVNSGLAAPKAIHIYNSSAQMWEGNKIGHVRVNGIWVPFIQYMKMLYDNGVEHVRFEVSYYYPTVIKPTITRNPNNFTFGVTSRNGSVAIADATTSIPIDVSNYNTLFVDWDPSNINYFGYRQISLSRIKIDSTDGEALYSVQQSASRRIESLDVSALSGLYYITVTVISRDGTSSSLSVYKLWLE